MLVSRDVYSYIAYGNIAGLHHANPYIQTPIDFPNDAVSSLVGPAWFSTPAVYGPLFTGFASLVVRAVDSVQAQVEVFRWTALVRQPRHAGVIATTVRRAKPSRAAFAVAAFGMNPVVLFSSVGSGHNDLLVAFLVAVALALLLAGREWLAVVALTLATRREGRRRAPAAPAGRVVHGPRAGRPQPPHVRHARGAGGRDLPSVCAAPFLNLHDPSLGMFELAGHEGWLAPSRFFRRLLDAVSGDTLGVVARIAFAARVAHDGRRAGARGLASAQRTDDRRPPRRRRSAPPGDGRSLLLMLLGPTLLPWYVMWALTARLVASPRATAGPAGHVRRPGRLAVDGGAAAVPRAPTT